MLKIKTDYYYCFIIWTLYLLVPVSVPPPVKPVRSVGAATVAVGPSRGETFLQHSSWPWRLETVVHQEDDPSFVVLPSGVVKSSVASASAKVNMKQPAAAAKPGGKSAVLSECFICLFKWNVPCGHRQMRSELSGAPCWWLLVLLAGGAPNARNSRKPWDLKGKVSDMEGKIVNYQTKVKSVNQENEVLRSSVAQTKMRAAEMEKELELRRNQIRCADLFQSWRSFTVFKH